MNTEIMVKDVFICRLEISKVPSIKMWIRQIPAF